MSIKISDIAVGYEYQTPTKQDRAVLGYDKNGRVVYASRGGNALNQYKVWYACKSTRFANACAVMGKKLTSSALNKIVKDTNAASVIA